jgi:hypothetical protein
MASARQAVAEHVRWADGVADSALPAQDRAEIHHLCRLLTERATGDLLRVGVFGQCSSGKSTLLNALLGTGLLPAAARLTTGVATWIWPAGSDTLAVTLHDGGHALDLGTSAFSAWFESAVGGDPVDIRTALRDIICSPRAASDLDRIDLRLTEAVLGPGVVVIDTPGFDAAAASHNEIAEGVAAEVDLAIVLIPASEPGAVSLGRFLHRGLGDLVDRCVFVLTKFLQVPEAERADVQEHIVSWLTQQGFGQTAVIRADATEVAVAVGDGRNAAAYEVPAEAALAESREIAERLGTLTAERRRQLIDATLAVLLGRLLAEVARLVTERGTALEETREHFDGVQIANLAEFLRNWRGGLAQDIALSAWSRVTQERSAAAPEEELSRARDRAVEKVRSGGDITVAVAELLRDTEAILGGWTARTVRRLVTVAGEELARRAALLRQTFTAQYARLAEATGADPTPPVFEWSLPAIAPGIDLSAAFEPARQAGRHLRSTTRWKKGGGAVAGAALGTAIAPGVGTLIGGTLGVVAGSGHRHETKMFRRAAEATHSDSLTAARDAIWRTGPAVSAALDEAASDLAARYLCSAGPVVERLATDYRAQVARLDAELREVPGILAETDRRRRALAEHGLRGA